MYPRTTFEMSEEQLADIQDACKPVPYMIVGGMPPPSPQENANRAWQRLGKEMGFDSMTVRPIDGMGPHFFTAVCTETDEVRDARLKQEAKERRLQEIVRLECEIDERRAMIADLQREGA